jgi:predicted FMN-binding regulatory protein PaiB
MYDSKNYPTSPEEAEAFVQSMRHGTLIATPPGGHPQVSILPFVKDGEVFHLHCVQDDPTFAAVRANPNVTFFVSDFLAFSPHDWINAEDAGRATLHFRAVTYECTATVSTEPAAVAAALAQLVGRLEPGHAHRALADDEFYGPRLRRLAALELTIVRYQAKFKLGPPGSAELKQEVVRQLRARNEPHDPRAADIIESSIKQT